MLLQGEEMEGREGATDKLGVPDPHSLRRRKLSLATKVRRQCYTIMLPVVAGELLPHSALWRLLLLTY